MTTRLFRRIFAFLLAAVLCCSYTVTAWARVIEIHWNDNMQDLIGTELYVDDVVIFHVQDASRAMKELEFYYHGSGTRSNRTVTNPVELTVQRENISNLKCWKVTGARLRCPEVDQIYKNSLILDLEAVLAPEQPVTPDDGNSSSPPTKTKKSETHTTPSWVLNPNEKQQLVASFAGLGEGMTIGYQEQGDAAKAAIRKAMLTGYKEAFEFNILNKDRQPEMTLKQGTVTLIIPAEYQKAGRQFSLIALTEGGQTILYSDTDNDPGTITVNLNHIGYAFSLIYKD